MQLDAKLRAPRELRSVRTDQGIDEHWGARARDLNARLEREELPVRLRNMTSVFTTEFTEPSRYAWLLQYYLRAEGLAMSWVGTGRLIFSHDYTDEAFAEVSERVVRAAADLKSEKVGVLPRGATCVVLEEALEPGDGRTSRCRGRWRRTWRRRCSGTPWFLARAGTLRAR